MNPLVFPIARLAAGLGWRRLRAVVLPETLDALGSTFTKACLAADELLTSGFGDTLSSTVTNEIWFEEFAELLIVAALLERTEELAQLVVENSDGAFDQDLIGIDPRDFFPALAAQFVLAIGREASRAGSPLANWFSVVSTHTILLQTREVRDLVDRSGYGLPSQRDPNDDLLLADATRSSLATSPELDVDPAFWPKEREAIATIFGDDGYLHHLVDLFAATSRVGSDLAEMTLTPLVDWAESQTVTAVDDDFSPMHQRSTDPFAVRGLTVLSGCAGVGKSWILRSEAKRLARACSLQDEDIDTASVPVYMPASALESAAGEAQFGSVPERLEALSRAFLSQTPWTHDHSSAEIAIVARQMSSGRAHLLVDRCEDILHMPQRSHVLAMIALLRSRGVTVTLGCRDTAERKIVALMSPLVGEVEIARVALLDGLDVVQNLEAKTVGPHSERYSRLLSIIRQSEEMNVLARNPLHLALLLQSADVLGARSTRHALYGVFLAKRLTEMGSNGVRVQRKIKLISAIAARLVLGPNPTGALAVSDLVEVVENDTDFRMLDATARHQGGIISELSEQDQILVRSVADDSLDENPRYQFFHDEVAEYLAAEFIRGLEISRGAALLRFRPRSLAVVELLLEAPDPSGNYLTRLSSELGRSALSEGDAGEGNVALQARIELSMALDGEAPLQTGYAEIGADLLSRVYGGVSEDVGGSLRRYLELMSESDILSLVRSRPHCFWPLPNMTSDVLGLLPPTSWRSLVEVTSTDLLFRNSADLWDVYDFWASQDDEALVSAVGAAVNWGQDALVAVLLAAGGRSDRRIFQEVAPHIVSSRPLVAMMAAWAGYTSHDSDLHQALSLLRASKEPALGVSALATYTGALDASPTRGEVASNLAGYVGAAHAVFGGSRDDAENVVESLTREGNASDIDAFESLRWLCGARGGSAASRFDRTTQLPIVVDRGLSNPIEGIGERLATDSQGVAVDCLELCRLAMWTEVAIVEASVTTALAHRDYAATPALPKSMTLAFDWARLVHLALARPEIGNEFALMRGLNEASENEPNLSRLLGQLRAECDQRRRFSIHPMLRSADDIGYNEDDILYAETFGPASQYSGFDKERHFLDRNGWT